MKFALVLLGCFAIAAAVPQQRGVLADVQAVVQGVITKAQSDLEAITTLVKEFSANAQANVQAIIANGLNSISTSIAAVESQISALISKGGSAALCAQKNLGELQGFKDNVGKTVQGCAGNFFIAAATMEQDTLFQVTSLKESVSSLVALVDECTQNFVQAMTCALTKTQEVQSTVDSVVSQAASAVEAAGSQAADAIAKIDNCVKQTVAEASIQANQYLSAVKQCA